MRTGISVTLTPPDRRRLEAITKDRNAPQKHAWRAAIVLLTADGLGTNEVMRQTATSKTCVWRWQQRFANHTILESDTAYAVEENLSLTIAVAQPGQLPNTAKST